MSNEPKPVVVHGKATFVAVTSATGKASTRSYFSTAMLRAAKRQAREVVELEASNTEWGDPHVWLILEGVMSTVVLAFSFVEAMINELFEDAADPRSNGFVEPLEADVIAAMGEWWTTLDKHDRMTNERKPALDKYKKALKLAGKGNVSGFASWGEAKALVELRNAVVHYRPTWSDDDGRPKELEARLAHRYEPSTLTNGVWWPNRALSAGCAEWCCATVESVADEFNREMGIEPNYALMRNRG